MDRGRRRFLQALLAAGLGVAAWGVLGRQDLRLEQVEAPIAGLAPALDGLRIALLADFHVGHFAGPELVERAVALAASAQPDLVLLLGDLVDNGAALPQLPQAAAAAGRLRPPLGTYAILGNHDYWSDAAAVSAALGAAGVHVLVNAGSRVDAGGAGLWLAGLDDVWEGRPDLPRALAGAPPGATPLLLVHEPDYADQAVRISGDRLPLQLSGHSHGGQIRLPLLGALHLPRLGRRYPAGLQRVEGGRLLVYTNRGVGVTGPPVRLFCPPEVTLLVLRAT